MASKRAASRSGPAPKAKRKRGDANADAAEEREAADDVAGPSGEPDERSTQPAAQTTGRREGMADIARRRAAHFAHFKADDDDDEDGGAKGNVHVGGEEACKLGPWSSARQLVEAREAAADARKERLAAAGTVTDDLVVDWKPSRVGWQSAAQRRGRTGIPSLSELCCVVVADHIGLVESLVGLPQMYLTQIARQVANRRTLSPEAWHLFTEGLPTEVVVPNCTQINEADMVKGLSECLSERLDRLELGFCGRGFGEKATAALAASASLHSLQSLHLAGAYRLQPDDALKVIGAAPAVQSLALPNCSWLRGDTVPEIAQRLPALTALDLSRCRGVEAAPLAEGLAKLPQLAMLALDEIPAVDDEVLAACPATVRDLRLSRCTAVTDAGLAAFVERARSLAAIDASATAITDATLAALARACPALHTLRLRKCAKLRGEAPLVAIAQNGALRRLDVSLCRGVSGVLLLELAASCAATLAEVDLSFCRDVQPAAFGLLLDKCHSLTEVRVFGCSQLTRACIYGHSNDGAVIVGAPTFEADEAAALVAKSATKTAAVDAAPLLNGEQSLAAVSGDTGDSDGMETI